jgi:hypothetical protein
MENNNMPTSQNSHKFTPTEIANQLTEETGIKISNRQVNQVLCELGFQRKVRTASKKYHWVLTDKGKTYGCLYRVTATHSSWSGSQIKWTEPIIELIKLFMLAS